jgi:hypothetical protein
LIITSYTTTTYRRGALEKQEISHPEEDHHPSSQFGNIYEGVDLFLEGEIGRKEPLATQVWGYFTAPLYLITNQYKSTI